LAALAVQKQVAEGDSKKKADMRRDPVVLERVSESVVPAAEDQDHKKVS